MATQRRIDLNADIGEGLDRIDEQLAHHLTSASIACGGHYGDESSMRRAATMCLERGLRIGAHPSYRDRGNFGRLSRDIPPDQLIEEILGQVNGLVAIVRSLGGHVEYVKPHGALYNEVASGGRVCDAILSASERLALPVMVLAGSPAAQTSRAPLIPEGFIDRRYEQAGRLMSRDSSGALITDSKEAAAQAVRLAPQVNSLCVHSDSPGAVHTLRAARDALEASGYEFGP